MIAFRNLGFLCRLMIFFVIAQNAGGCKRIFKVNQLLHNYWTSAVLGICYHGTAKKFVLAIIKLVKSANYLDASSAFQVTDGAS